MELNNHWGRLERVPLRTGWENEADDFTPWLAEEENILLLGNAIGIDLEIEAQEKQVGKFRADILCKDTATDQWVLIENQLERTDHNHLGQLITYAAGLSAVTIIWVSSEFTDEHRGALDWLNEITPDEIRFFGIEIELWRIGDSPIAPKFNIVSKPNDWTKPSSGVRRRFAASNSPTKQLQLEYWEAFHEVMKQSDDSAVRPTKPQPQHWQQFSIGRTGFHLRALANIRDKWIGVQLILGGDDAKGHYGILSYDKDEIQHEAGKEFEWRGLPEKKRARSISGGRNAILLTARVGPINTRGCSVSYRISIKYLPQGSSSLMWTSSILISEAARRISNILCLSASIAEYCGGTIKISCWSNDGPSLQLLCL